MLIKMRSIKLKIEFKKDPNNRSQILELTYIENGNREVVWYDLLRFVSIEIDIDIRHLMIKRSSSKVVSFMNAPNMHHRVRWGGRPCAEVYYVDYICVFEREDMICRDLLC